MINPVNSNYSCRNINFTSRDHRIRKADDVARQVNKAYPRVSQSIIIDYQNIDKFPQIRRRYTDKIKKLRNDQAYILFDDLGKGNFMDELTVIPDLVCKYRVGNCGEAAILSAIAAKVNGIDNFCIAGLDSSETGDLDHAVLLVNPEEKPYIIDSWLGFADYLPEAINRYKSEYGYHFDLNDSPYEKIEVDAIPSGFLLNLKLADKKELQEAFPELMLPKTKEESEKQNSFKEKLKNFFGFRDDKKLDKMA